MFTYLKENKFRLLVAFVTLAVLGLVRVFHVHGDQHIPTIAGLSFGILPAFLGETKSYTAEEIAAKVTPEVQKSIGGTITEAVAKAMQEASAASAKLVSDLQAEVKALKESFKPEDVAKQLSLMANAIARDELTKLSADEDTFLRAKFCLANPDNQNNKKAQEIYKHFVSKADFNNIVVAGEGGDVVPTAFSTAVLSLAVPASIVLQDADIVPLGSGIGSFKMPTNLGGISFSYPGEGGEIVASKAAFGLETITPKLGAALVPVSKELLDMNNIGLVGYLAKLFGEASGTDIDTQLFAQTTIMAAGLRDSGSLLSHPISAYTFEITLAELLQTPGKLTSAGKFSWYIHPSTLWQFILQLENTLGESVFKDLWNQETKLLLGYKVREVNNPNAMYDASASGQDRNFALLCDMKQALKVALPGGDQMSVSDAASVVVGGTTYNAFQQNLVVFKYQRYLGAAAPNFSPASLYPGVAIKSKTFIAP